MIFTQTTVPQVRMPDGELKTLAQCGIPHLLATAAREEGMSQWWLADDVVVGVRAYLAWHRGGEVIEAGELERALLTALVAIGHPEIARRIRTQTGQARVCLEELAHLARDAAGYEMTFFVLLQNAVDEVVRSPAPAAHFGRLQGAVQTLLGVRRWSPACEKLKEDIIDQIHGRIGKSGRTLRLALTLK